MKRALGTGARPGLAGSVLVAFLLAVPATGRSEETTAEPDDVKAVLLTRIAEFITWPGASGAPDAPTNLCFLNDNALGGRWRQLEGFKSGTTGRPFKFTLVTPASLQSVPDQCQALFVDRESEPLFILENALLVGKPVLTVGESEQFLSLGGMVTLFIQDERPRFDINLPPLKAAGLQAESGLLGLARRVRAAAEN